jgi:hypothetical protein
MGRGGVSVSNVIALEVPLDVVSALVVPSMLLNFTVVMITIPISTKDSTISANTQERLNTVGFIDLAR